VKNLLNGIIALPQTLPFKKTISGGIKLMKIGTSKGVTTSIFAATQSLMFSVIFHLALFITLSSLYQFHTDRQKVDTFLQVSIIPTEEQQSIQRPSQAGIKNSLSITTSLPKIELTPKTPRGFFSATTAAQIGAIGSPIHQAMKELPISTGVKLNRGDKALSDNGKDEAILPTASGESVSTVGKSDIGLANGMVPLARDRGNVGLRMTEVAKQKAVIGQREKLSTPPGLSLVGNTGTADANDTLASVTKDMILDRTEFSVPELPKGEPGGIIIGRGKDIKGRLRFGRLRCSMIDERCLLELWKVSGALNRWMKWINANTNINVDMNVEGGAFSLTDANLFKCPVLFLFGYDEMGIFGITSSSRTKGTAKWGQCRDSKAATRLSSSERQGLRKYLVERGGVLFVDTMCRILALHDGNIKKVGPHYPWSTRMKRELRNLLPEYNLQKISNEHKLYHCFYDLAGAPPGISQSGTGWGAVYWGHLAPSTPPEGISIDNRLAVIYSESGLASMTGSYFMRSDSDYLSIQAAYRFLTNVVVYSLTHSGISDKSRYVPEKEMQGDAEEIPKKPPFIPQPTPNLRP
jgi:hypothetical protein